MSRLEKLPDWPARMTAPVAAAYMGVSETTFMTRFGNVGVREGSNKLWAKVQLDRLIAEQFGLAAAVPSTSHDPVEDEIAAWKAGRGRK